ncbi:uncharacterized protein PAC_14961 [Phialocephala subalpina]|uniref:Uncharacterized protein n=1 Tax=Phialocephala subalpina TaxID=576137 RepID=A0A1L7XJ54_9HELO|nr:uncharacterized protein PAC_14961 [Phialocephala subalpina]
MGEVKPTSPDQGGVNGTTTANISETPVSAPVAPPKTNGIPATPLLTKIVPKSSATAPVPGTKPTSAPPKQAPKAPVSSVATSKSVAKATIQSITPGSKPATTAASNGAPSAVKLTAAASGPSPKAVSTAPGTKPTASIVGKPVPKPASPSVPKSTPGATPASKPPTTGQAAPTSAKSLPLKVAGAVAKSPQAPAKGPGPSAVKAAAPGSASTKSVQPPTAAAPISVPTTTPGFLEKTDKFFTDGTKTITGVSTFLGALGGLLGDDKKADVKAAAPAAKAVPAKSTPAPAVKTPAPSAAKPVPDTKTAAKPNATPKLSVKDVHVNPPHVLQHDQTTLHADPQAQSHSQLPQHTQAPEGLESTMTSQPYVPVSHLYSHDREVIVDEYEQYSVPMSANILIVGEEALPVAHSTGYWIAEGEGAPQQHHTHIAEEGVTYVEYTEVETGIDQVVDEGYDHPIGGYEQRDEPGEGEGDGETTPDDVVVIDAHITYTEDVDVGEPGVDDGDYQHGEGDFDVAEIIVPQHERYAEFAEGEAPPENGEEQLWSDVGDIDAGEYGMNQPDEGYGEYDYATPVEHQDDENDDGMQGVDAGDDEGLTIVYVDVAVDMTVDNDQGESDDGPTTDHDDGERQDGGYVHQDVGDIDVGEVTYDNHYDIPDSDGTDEPAPLVDEEEDTSNDQVIDDEDGDGDDGPGQAGDVGADSDGDNNGEDKGADSDGEGGGGDDGGYRTPQADDGEDSD